MGESNPARSTADVGQPRPPSSSAGTLPPPIRPQNAPGQAPDRYRGSRLPSFVTGRSGRWPLSSFLELGALDGAVPSARLHARHIAREWGLAALTGDIQLVVSELVTNAVHASRTMAHAAIGLWLASDQSRLAITVWDASPDPPKRVEAAHDEVSGRGLLLVEEVSAQWGWYVPLGHDRTPGEGKLVWAIVAS